MNKKTFTLLCALFSCICTFADDFVAGKSMTIASAGKSAVAELHLYKDSYDANVQQIQFDVYTSNPLLSVTNITAYQNDGTILPYSEEEDWDNIDDDGNPGIKKTFVGTFSKDNAEDHLGVVFANPTLETFKAGNGIFARIVIKADATLPTGSYAVVIKNVIISGTDAVAHTLPNTSFVVKVGEGEAIADLEAIVPSLSTKNIPANASVDLSNVTEMNGSNANNVTVKYNRTVSNEWNTICLPVDAKSDANIQYYTISKIGSDALEVAGVSTLAAGTPALAKVTGSAINISATSALSTTLKNGGNLIGTFEPINVTDADAYYIKNNKFYQCNGNFNVAAFKAYIKKAASGAKAILDITESDATAINAICGEGEVTVDAIYGVNGARQNDLKKGINIVTLSNGATKKIIVK